MVTEARGFYFSLCNKLIINVRRSAYLKSPVEYLDAYLYQTLEKMGVEKWIVFVEDDLDLHYLYERVFANLHLEEKLKLFDNASDALEFISQAGRDIAVIFSDVNMPLMDGIEMKRRLDTDPKFSKLSIPFVFLSTSANERDIRQAEELNIQGFFQKGVTLDELQETIKLALHIWDNYPLALAS
jgi:CheY-like chemotaxis protein